MSTTVKKNSKNDYLFFNYLLLTIAIILTLLILSVYFQHIQYQGLTEHIIHTLEFKNIDLTEQVNQKNCDINVLKDKINETEKNINTGVLVTITLTITLVVMVASNIVYYIFKI